MVHTKDFTEKEKSTAENSAGSEISDINRAKFWAQISHKLRTPLNVVTGMADILKNKIYDIDKVKYGMERIQESSRTLMKLADNIIDFSAIEDGTLKIENECFNLRDLITNLTILNYEHAKENHKHFDIHIHGVTEETLSGDEKRLRQILQSLLDYIITQTPSDGRIDFSVTQTSHTRHTVHMHFVIQTNADLSNNRLLDRLCVPFCNNSDLAKDTADFTDNGIWLVIIRYLLKQMNCIVRMNSSEGSCELVLDIPFHDTDNESGTKPLNIFENERVLILDADKKLCAEKGAMLESIDIHYDTAADSQTALDMIGEAEDQNIPYCMCIADWNIGKTSIENFVYDVRQIFGRDMIIAVTVYDASARNELIEKLGVNYVIEKTWFRSTLFDAMMTIKSGRLKHNEHDTTADIKYRFTGKHILVAEDISLNMEVIVRLLSRVNAAVTCVENGQEALDAYNRRPSGYFDCILMDINMPVMDGYEASRLIRNSHKKDSAVIPIYAMTANAFSEDISEAIKAGMNGHIAKPIDVDVLYKLLYNLFSSPESSYELTFRQKAEVLQKQNEELKMKAEHDPLTGLLNRYAFEKMVSAYIQNPSPTGFLIADIDGFKRINDIYGHDVGDKVLIKIASLLTSAFAPQNSVIRLGGDEFAVFINGTENTSDFVINCINHINEQLTLVSGSLPLTSISAGFVFSPEGYNRDLYQLADKALYSVKNQGGHGCRVYSEQVDLEVSSAEQNHLRPEYGGEIYYVTSEGESDFSTRKNCINLILKNNNAVGVISGYNDHSLSIHAVNGFALNSLGYNYQEFLNTSQGSFASLIFEDDIPLFKDRLKETDFSDFRIRLLNKNGKYIWFNEAHVSAPLSNGKSLWIASFRLIEDSLIGELCSMDYSVISLIDSRSGTVIFEKGNDPFYSLILERKKKYHYNSLMEKTVFPSLFIKEKQDTIQKLNLNTIIEKLKTDNVYEVIAFSQINDSRYRAVRHKFRCLRENTEMIVYTQEFVDSWVESDEITGLLNEQGFYRKVPQIIQNSSSTYVILYFDIKGFKAINETLGSRNANEVLRQFGEYLELSEFHPTAVSRILADHFVCLVEKRYANENTIRKACSIKVCIDGRNIQLRLNCGIYVINDKNFDVRRMCAMASLAKGYVNNEFAVPYSFFDSDMNERYLQSNYVLDNFRKALDKGEFRVFYQPIISGESGKIISAEALVRWILPGGKTITPGEFLPALEAKGYIAELDLYIARSVQKYLESRMNSKKNYVPVSMNLSRMDFYNEKYIRKLINSISASAVEHSYLRFEVTESCYLDLKEKGLTTLTQLRSMGTPIMLDDFGTGFSALSNLIAICFDYLKIDRTFISQISKNATAEAIIRSIISTCHTVNVGVIAEGVETEEQYLFLTENSCDCIQGFYKYRPMAEDEFSDLLDIQQ